MTATTTAPQSVEGVQVGDFFSCSWGYDETHVDFYKVVGLTAKCIRVQRWKSQAVSDPHAPQVSVVPGDGPATFIDWSAVDFEADWHTQQQQKAERPEKVELKRLRSYTFSGQRRVSFTVNSFSNAYKWDGQPESQTGIGWGR